MHRIRTLAASGLVALAVGACGASTSTTAPSVPVDGSPTGDVLGASPEAPSPSPGASASVDASPSAGAFIQLFPVFEPQGDADISGGAIITEVEGGSSVVIGVVAPGATEAFPVAIVEGDCASQTTTPTPPAQPSPEVSPSASPGAAAASPDASPSPAAASPDASASAGIPEGFPMWLTDVAAGSSNTVVPLSVADLTGAPHSIIILNSYADPTVQACADLTEGGSPAGGEASDAPDAAGSPEASPASS